MTYPKGVYGGSPPHNWQDTSVAAASAILEASDSLRGRVYRLIKSWPGGGTDEQVQLELEMRVQTETARRRELVLMGVVIDSGYRQTLTSGRQGIVWVTVIPPARQGELGL